MIDFEIRFLTPKEKEWRGAIRIWKICQSINTWINDLFRKTGKKDIHMEFKTEFDWRNVIHITKLRPTTTQKDQSFSILYPRMFENFLKLCLENIEEWSRFLQFAVDTALRFSNISTRKIHKYLEKVFNATEKSKLVEQITSILADEKTALSFSSNSILLTDKNSIDFFHSYLGKGGFAGC